MKNKQNLRYLNATKLSSLLVLLLLISIAQSARAQMFSVEGNTRDYSIPTALISLGIEQVNFEFTGDLGPGVSDAFEFKGSILRLRAEIPNIFISFGTGGSITNLENHSYFEGLIKADYSFLLFGNNRIQLGLPLQLISSLTNVDTDQIVGIQTGFRQADVTAGAGLRLSGRPGNRFRVQVKAIPSYGFSTATGGSFGGSVFIFEGRAKAFFDRVFGDVGLSFGYDYNYKSFDIEGNLFDYNLNSHGFLIGVTF